ncbi:MAG: hypothetical protein JWN57_2620 [Frankiales bacterium]|jgi:hypothetical protein|nr:hypothetical protein [Frankiales bacterium]
MYGGIWRALPGPLALRVLIALLLLLAVLALLFLVVFPRVEELLPYSDVTVTGEPPPA